MIASHTIYFISFKAVSQNENILTVKKNINACSHLYYLLKIKARLAGSHLSFTSLYYSPASCICTGFDLLPLRYNVSEGNSVPQIIFRNWTFKSAVLMKKK